MLRQELIIKLKQVIILRNYQNKLLENMNMPQIAVKILTTK
jgi:hypothetical protein